MARRKDEDRVDELLEFHQKLTQSAASNPGRLKVNWAQYLWCFPGWPVLWVLATLVSLALAMAVHGGFWVLVAIVLLLDFAWWFRTRMHFIGGCINPGKVVSVNPPLIAVYTDLTKRNGVSHPVVKVLPHPFRRMAGGPFREGHDIAAIATYEIGDDDTRDHWSDFYPVAVQCATRDPEEIDRVYDSLDEDSWETLDLALKQVPRPVEPGLYRIRKRRKP